MTAQLGVPRGSWNACTHSTFPCQHSCMGLQQALVACPAKVCSMCRPLVRAASGGAGGVHPEPPHTQHQQRGLCTDHPAAETGALGSPNPSCEAVQPRLPKEVLLQFSCVMPVAFSLVCSCLCRSSLLGNSLSPVHLGLAAAQALVQCCVGTTGVMVLGASDKENGNPSTAVLPALCFNQGSRHGTSSEASLMTTHVIWVCGGR